MRHVYTIENLPDDVLRAIAESKVDPKYDYLNDLLDDEKPADNVSQSDIPEGRG